jgi:hypothetical protein
MKFVFVTVNCPIWQKEVNADNRQERFERKEIIEKSSACGKCLELELLLKEALFEPSSAQF